MIEVMWGDETFKTPSRKDRDFLLTRSQLESLKLCQDLTKEIAPYLRHHRTAMVLMMMSSHIQWYWTCGCLGVPRLPREKHFW